MAKIAVTGGAGFIGSHVVERLVEKGHEVSVIDDLSRGKLENLASVRNKIQFHQNDLKFITHTNKAIQGAEAVIHMAVMIGGVKFMLTHETESYENSLIDFNVFKVCRLQKIQNILFTSSACIYPTFKQTEEGKGLLTEEDALWDGAKPESIYGWCKLFAEQALEAMRRELGTNIVILRPFNAYGPREVFDLEKSHAIPALMVKAHMKQDPFEIWGRGIQKRAFTYVDDVADAIVIAYEKMTSGEEFLGSPTTHQPNIINIGTTDSRTIDEIAQMILKEAGYSPKIKHLTDYPEGVFQRMPDIRKAKELLGWKPTTSLSEGISKTWNWYVARSVA